MQDLGSSVKSYFSLFFFVLFVLLVKYSILKRSGDHHKCLLLTHAELTSNDLDALNRLSCIKQ